MANEIMEVAGTSYCFPQSQLPVLEDLASRVQIMREGGRLNPQVLYRLRKFFKIKNIYHSNAIEGNLLDVGETRQVVELGMTITGKSMKDQAEAKNLSAALDLLEDLAGNASEPIREFQIRQLHQLILKGIDDENAGKYRLVRVAVSGSSFKPPGPEAVPSQMEEFGKWLAGASIPDARFATVDGLINAAVAHTWFVSIHPFVDGNGRASRMLLNLMLMRYGFPIAVLTKEDRRRYFDSLEQSQSSDLSAFLALLIECIGESLEEYEKAAAEQVQQHEWAQALADRFSAPEKIRARNEYEVWYAALELFKSHARQTVALLSEATRIGNAYFKDFGVLEFEKYLSLRVGESVKRTWFFRVDFRRAERTARYLFFFGFASSALRGKCDSVTLHVSREEPAGSFFYERLDRISAPNVPSLLEVGYDLKGESFIARFRGDHTRSSRIEDLGRLFFEEVVKMHFAQ